MSEINRHVAFLSSSFEYTRGIVPFTRRLEERGYTVFWISFRGYECEWLKRNGVPAARILDTWSGVHEGMFPDRELWERLARLEDGKSPFVNDLILMDRMLKRKPYLFAVAYLAHIERVLTRFLVENRITLVSAGRDSALQFSCAKICARLRIPSVVPTVTRIPDDRYGFCLGHTDAEFVRFRDVTDADRDLAGALLREFRDKRPIPATIVLERKNNRFLRRVPRDLGLWFQTVRRGAYDRNNDFTRYTVTHLFDMYWRRRMNALRVKLAPVFEPLGSRPFVLYAYQMQPESSIDVLANVFSDQKALITQIARAVPATHELYVKPHPDHVGGLSRAALQELRAIPGVRLINPFENSHELMLRSSLVLTPSGTMAFEAALHGIPSITFANEFFTALPTVVRCDSPPLLPELIRRLVRAPHTTDDRPIEDFLAQLFANSFPGRVTDYFGPFSEAEFRSMSEAYDLLYDVLYSRAFYGFGQGHAQPATGVRS